MLSLSVIVAERNQTGDSGMEVASTAVITHRHGDHFWPAVDGPEEGPLFNQIGPSVVGQTPVGRTPRLCGLSWVSECVFIQTNPEKKNPA